MGIWLNPILIQSGSAKNNHTTFCQKNCMLGFKPRATQWAQCEKTVAYCTVILNQPISGWEHVWCI